MHQQGKREKTISSHLISPRVSSTVLDWIMPNEDIKGKTDDGDFWPNYWPNCNKNNDFLLSQK
jgi:hypothetical protein